MSLQTASLSSKVTVPYSTIQDPNLLDSQSEEGCSQIKIQAAKNAIAQGIISDEQPIALFYNNTILKKLVNNVKEAFPGDRFLHTMALKANPLKKRCEEIHKLGIGFEAASDGELAQGLKVADPSQVVFDSPVKTTRELVFSLKKGVYLNIDNLQELKRVKHILETTPINKEHANIGLRINPQIGLGGIKEFSTGGPISKFGVALDDFRAEILQTYRENSWLNGIHVHVGSQGCALPLIVSGIKKVYQLIEEINAIRKTQNQKDLDFFDIGGGFPVNFNSESIEFGEEYPHITTYAQMLKSEIPDLFDPAKKFKVITEFGRYYNAKSGFFVSKIEYTKHSGGRSIAMMHGSLDLFVRTVMMPNVWRLRVTVLDSKGNVKQVKKEDKIKQDIAGPCCIAGDLIANERLLPQMEEGDWIVVHDTGGYYLNAYSYYNSRQAPASWSFDEADTSKFENVTVAKTVEDTLAQYS